MSLSTLLVIPTLACKCPPNTSVAHTKYPIYIPTLKCVHDIYVFNQHMICILPTHDLHPTNTCVLPILLSPPNTSMYHAPSLQFLHRTSELYQNCVQQRSSFQYFRVLPTPRYHINNFQCPTNTFSAQQLMKLILNYIIIY